MEEVQDGSGRVFTVPDFTRMDFSHQKAFPCYSIKESKPRKDAKNSLRIA
jgi:hypothetical protein